MKNLQDIYYKKFEADNYFARWKKNDIKEYMDVSKGKLRKEKIKILNYLLSNINLKNKNVLEIGCFVGDLLFYLKKKFKCNVKGVEASAKACKFSKKVFKLKTENKIFVESEFFSLDKKNYKKFDLIICDDVLSWIDRDAIIPSLSSIDWLLRDNGHLFLRDFTPQRNFALRNHHYKKLRIYNFKQKNGHKALLLRSGKYIEIKNKTYLSKRFNKKIIKYKEANVWSDTILKKIKDFSHPIIKL